MRGTNESVHRIGGGKRIFFVGREQQKKGRERWRFAFKPYGKGGATEGNAFEKRRVRSPVGKERGRQLGEAAPLVEAGEATWKKGGNGGKVTANRRSQ